MTALEEEVSRLYCDPVIGGGNANPFGEQNIKNLLKKYRDIEEPDMEAMLILVKNYSKSGDLASCYVSVGVLHALGMTDAVEEAYQWAQTQDNPRRYASHFDIGKSIAEYVAFGG